MRVKAIQHGSNNGHILRSRETPHLSPSLKSLLLTVYNPVVHSLRKSRRWALAFAQVAWTPCAICGRNGPKLFVPEAVGDELVAMWGLNEAEAFDLRLKESLICPWCGSKHRARRLAAVFAEEARNWPRNDLAGSNTDDTNPEKFTSNPVLILNRIDGFDRMRMPAVISEVMITDYAEGAEPGEIVDGIRHEDVQRLTFADGEFAFVIDSETLEHVPDLHQGLCEIFRVLRPGGLHIFTVPMKPGTERTESRIERDASGAWTDRMLPRLHHPGGSWGWEVHTEFGADFASKLQAMGWEVRIDSAGSEDLKLYGRDCVCDVYVTRKPG